MEAALRGDDCAAVLIETIPATYGFPLPDPGYLKGVKELCERHGALYIADEVQTGLMRTGEMWGIAQARRSSRTSWSTGKGISGGMYPISRGPRERAAAGWLNEDGFGHISTFGGAELGCIVALKVAGDLRAARDRARWCTTSPTASAAACARSRRAIRTCSSASARTAWSWAWSSTTREGAKFVMRHLYENGVWAIFSTLDPRVLQFKPGILLGPELVRGNARPHRGRDRRALAELRGDGRRGGAR